MENNNTQVAVETAENNANVKNKTFRKKKTREDMIPSYAKKFPEHIKDIALLIHNNAEIKRFTALGILNYLTQKGEIKGSKKYVVFKWNKFAVRYDGLTREYFYTEPFFLNALVASFSNFSASAQRIIDQFARKEMSVGIDKAVDSAEVNEIVFLNEADVENKNTAVVDEE